MSVRFDTTGDALRLTTGMLDYNLPYTVCGWVRPQADPNVIQMLLVLAQSGTAFDRLRSLSNGDNWAIQAAHVSNATGNGSLIAYGVWAHVAQVRVNATTLQFYLNGVLNATATFDITGRAAPVNITLGANNAGSPGDLFNSRAHAWKAWQAALTAGEIQTEMRYVRAIRRQSLYAEWWMLPGSRKLDYSGNGHHFTELGALTDEEPYPLAWSQPVWSPVLAGAVVADEPYPLPYRSLTTLARM